MTSSATSTDVLVIGAGLAGLTAARTLTKGGVSVLVLEARDRVGGRTNSVQAGPCTIDLGAQSICDKQRRISALTDEFGLTRMEHSDTGAMLHRDAPEAPVRRMNSDTPLNCLGQLDVLQSSWRVDSSVKALSDKQREKLDSQSLASLLRKKTFFQSSRKFLEYVTESDMCASLDDISAYEFLHQLRSMGGMDVEPEEYYLKEGTQAFANRMAAELAGRVILSSPVSAIAMDGEGVKVTANDVTYSAKYLVVAVPPQLYANIGLLPLLPAHRQDALEGWVTGAAVKTLIVWDKPWWTQYGLSGDMSAPKDLFNQVMAGCSSPGQPGLLVLFSTGASGRRMSEVDSEQERIDKAMSFLEQMFGQAIPAPLGARSMNWCAEPYSVGGYASFPKIGARHKAPDLFQSFQNIHFAGTETADEWRSYMEGAVQSGQRAGTAILGAMRAS